MVIYTYNIDKGGYMYSPKQFAEKIGKSVKTLQRWDNDGIFKARRTPTNRRYYTEDDLQLYLSGEFYNVVPQMTGTTTSTLKELFLLGGWTYL